MGENPLNGKGLPLTRNGEGEKIVYSSCENMRFIKPIKYMKYNYEQVKSIIKDLGYELLSNEYINSKTKLNIKDEVGYLYSATLDNLLNGKRPQYLSKHNPFTIHNIKLFLKINNSNSTLISKEIEDCKSLIEFKCECGNFYKCSIDKMSNRKKTRCNKCGVNTRASKKRIRLKDVVQLFEKESLIPMFNSYNSCNERLLCRDEFGYLGLLSYRHLKNGSKFDIVGKYNPYSIHNIERYIKLNGLKCKIISKEFKNANYKLKFECECGDNYETIWRTFMTFNNDRCPKCSKKQSQYERKIEDYLVDNKLNYQKEYTFDDCRNINVLPFDFMVRINNSIYLLEVDGETHFKPAWKGVQGLKTQQRRDKIKNDYCKKNNIKLIRISYKEIKDNSYLLKMKKELS